ncbi:hypothetical protein OIY81_3143 [Cryptosporidium canis]|nr:hypothetical protein OIY81_3143 [Cryptosporidium canis]
MASSRARALLDLPKEIIVGICYFLDPRDTISLSLVCNSAYLIIHNNPIIWRFYCHKYGFVQSKRGRKWCSERAYQAPEEEAVGGGVSKQRSGGELGCVDNKRNTHMPKDEVEPYSIEFGEDTGFLGILEYGWWGSEHSRAEIDQGKRPVPDLDSCELESMRLDISLATELVNWRLVFYMNILNEDSNHIFWLRIGTSIDIMTPITSVKIDPKIYRDMDDSIIHGIFDFAKKIKYLSTLHTCRHFIRLPCPIRIREILIGGRVGNIITSEPSSHGRYLLELPKELVHMVDNIYDVSAPKCGEEDFVSTKKLQLPININRRLFLDQSQVSGSYDCIQGEGLCKRASSSIEFVTVANAFISYANNPSWETSLSPRSISAFKQVWPSGSEDCQLFAEVLSRIRQSSRGECGGLGIGAINDYYSNMNLTHSPVNCTTPCSVINRTCNLEFQNIRQYFKMLCSNSIIFNMFATSINLQDSPLDDDQTYSCWCEYPKSLLGCTWYYNPTRSNLREIKSFSSGVFSSMGDFSIQGTRVLGKLGPAPSLELMLSISRSSHDLEGRLKTRFLSLNREEASLADLIYLVKASVDGESKESAGYSIFILKGIGWRRQYGREAEEHGESDEILALQKEVERRIYGEKLTKSEKVLSKLRVHSGDLLGSLTRHLFFVSGEKITVEVKQIETDEIHEDLKEQYKIHKEFIIPISWSLDGLKVSSISFLPIKSETEDACRLSGEAGNSGGLDECRYGLQRSFSGISNMPTMPSFSSFSSLEGHLLGSAVKFPKCNIVTLSREPNRFKCHMDRSNGRPIQLTSGGRQEFCLKSIVKNTNEVYKELVSEKTFGEICSRPPWCCHLPVQNTLYAGYSPYEGDVIGSLEEERRTKSQYKFTLLNSSQDTRQFEFHPERSDLILIGTSLGKIKLADRYKDSILAEQGISVSPIIGLSWFNSHPQTFIAGSCLFGAISILSYKENPFYQPMDPCQEEEDFGQKYGRADQDGQDGKHPYLINTENNSKSFPQLSSLSVNATDDYYLASGFGKSVGLYSTYTGAQVKILPNMHMSHINIVRFANYHPHIFSTVSFDSSCKIWDLRQKISGNDPVIRFELPCMAIMSCFSPKDDLKVVVSGVDNYLKELDLRYSENSASVGNREFVIPPLRDSQSYRRSVYNSNGDLVLSVNTKDKFLRIFDSRDHSSKFKLDCFNAMNSYEELLGASTSRSSLIIGTFADVATPRGGCNTSSIQLERGVSGSDSSSSSGEMVSTTGDGDVPVVDGQGQHAGPSEDSHVEQERKPYKEKDYSLLSVRGHPIYADVGGFLISEPTGDSKVALLKFGCAFD